MNNVEQEEDWAYTIFFRTLTEEDIDEVITLTDMIRISLRYRKRLVNIILRMITDHNSSLPAY